MARDSRGGGIDGGIDILTIPLEKIKTADVLDDHLKTKEVHRLRICFKNGLRVGILEIPLIADIQDIKFMINIFKIFLRN